MPDDKLPIPQFAAKIKAKYPAYKDVNDTLLVQKILAKYPEYESQVDMSGLSTVKKKETVSQPTGFGSSIGGQVGTSVPQSEEDKIKSLLSTVKHSPTTPEDIERNERWKRVMEPELQITEADFQEDPVSSANRIILSKTPGVKNRQPVASSTAVDTPLGMKIAAKQEKPIPKTDSIPFKDAEDKIKEVRNYFAQNTDTSLEHLRQLTGATNGDQLFNEGFDEIIKQSLRPGNETDRIAYDRLQVAKAARKSIEENVSRGRGLEDMAFDFAAANDPENAAVIQELKKTPSFNELLQGVTSVDRKAEDAFGNATVGQFLYQFLGNTAVQQELARIPGMTQQARNAANELLDKYPEFGRRYLGQMISQKMGELGINNSILNVATKEERDRAVAALVKEGKMTSKEEAFYKENIRPLSGVGLLLRKVTGNPIIDTPGGIENALSGAYQGFKGLPKGLYEATFKDAVLGQQGALAKDFEMANRQIGIKPKGLLHEIVQNGGQFLGQSLSIGGGGNILKNAKILTNPKAAMAVAGGVQAFANYMPYARQMFPGNQLKQQGFATILSGLEMATENIFNDRKVVDGLLGKLKPGVAETIQQFTSKKISAEAARAQVEGLIKKALRDLPDAAKYFSKGVGQNTIEEVTAQLGQQVTEGVFTNKPISEWIDGEDLWNTARQAFLGSGFIAGLSTRADMQKNRGITAKTIYTMAENPDYWKGQMREAGRLMPPEQANDIQDKINNLDKAAKIVAELEGTNLTQKQKVKFLITKLEQDIKSNQTKEAVIPAIQEKAAKELEKVQEDLLDGKDDGTIEGDQSDELTPAEMKAVKIAAKEPLPGVYQEQLDNDPIGVIRDIAEQAQGVSSDGTPLNGGSRTNDLLSMGVSQKFIDAAIEAFPVEKPQTTNIETGKGVMEGDVMSEVEINDEKVQLPEPGFVIGDVYLKEGEEKGKGSGQELYKNALDKHGVLYSFNPVSEDALRVQDKLVEKGIARVEVIELPDGTQVRKITKAELPAPQTNTDNVTTPTPPVQEGKGDKGGGDVEGQKALKAYPELKGTKVVNEDGTPKIVYHGGRIFDGFKIPDSEVDKGIYFTDNPDFALYFAHQAELVERDKRGDDYSDVPNDILESGEPFPEKYLKYAKLHRAYLDMKNPKEVDAIDAASIPKNYEKGKDGFIAKTTGDFGYKGGQYVVFDPKQIKSADTKAVEQSISTPTQTSTAQPPSTPALPSVDGEAATPAAERKKPKEKGVMEKARGIEDLTDPVDIVMQYFVRGNKINSSAIQELYGGKDQRLHFSKGTGGEHKSKISLLKTDAPGIKELAHRLWEDSGGLEDGYPFTDQDFREAIETVLQSHNSPASMAKELVSKYVETAVRQEMTDEELNLIQEGLIRELGDFVEQMDENEQFALVQVLRQYQDSSGFINWEKLEDDYNGFEPIILDLPTETKSKLYAIIQKNLQSGQSEHSNAIGKDGGKESQKEQANERLKTAQSTYDKAAKELQAAEDKIAQSQAKQTDMFGGTQKEMFAGDGRESAKQILDPLRTKVKEAKAELDAAQKSIDNLTEEPELGFEQPPTLPEVTTEQKATFKSLADKIRKGKIDDDITMSGIPFLKQVWNGAVEAAAVAVEATGKIADGIKAGIDHIKESDWYKNLTKEQQERAEKRFTAEFEEPATTEPPPAEPPPPPKGEEGGTGVGFELSFAGLQGMADEFGFEQVRSRDRVSDAQEIENARSTANEWKDKGVYEKNVQDLLKKIENRELVPTAAQRLLLQQYIANKKHELSLIEDKTSKEFNDKLQEVKRLKDIGQIARQEAGAALRIGGALQSHPVEDLTDAIIGMQETNGVDELTKEQTAQVEKLVKDYQEKTKAAEEKVAELEAKLAEMEAAKAVGEAKKYKKSARQKTAEQFKQERGRIVEDIREKLKKARGETNVTGVPYLKELIAIAPDVKKLVSNLVEQGITELSQIIDDIHEYLKDEITGITKGDVRDIIAGKYNEKRPTKSQLQQQLRDIRDEADLLRKLEELENGIEPVSERKRVERNQRIKLLRDRIRIIQQRNNYVSPGEKRLQDEISRNKKQEERIRKDIEDGNFSQPEKATKWTQSDDLKKNFPKLYNEALDALAAKEDAKRDYDVAQFKAQQSQRGKVRKGIDLIRALIATSKAIKSGIDDSAIMIQNAVAMVSHPRSALKALREHALDAISEKRFRRYLTELHESPIWNLMQKSGLDITDPKTLNEQNREEVFDNNLLNKDIKIKGKKYNIGKYVTRPFERAFTSLGNAMRVNMFTKIAERMMAEGKTFETHPEEFKSLATVLNTETGRGKLHTQIQRASQLVTAGIWSPRLMASRLNMLGISELAPLYGGKGYYKGLTPEMRKMAIQDMAKFVSAGIAFMAFAGSQGAGVDDDPESPTFGTIQVGEKKYNAWGGFTPYVKTIVQGATGKRNIRGERKPVTRSKILGSFFRSRLTPAAGVTTDLITGKDFSGKPITTEGELMNLAAPLSISGIIDGVKKDGMIGLLTQGLPSFVGIGVSDERDFEPSDSKKSIKLKYKDPKTRKPISRESTPEEYKKYVEEKGKIFDAAIKKYTPESNVYLDEYGEVSLSRTRSIKKYKSLTDDEKKELETKLKRRAESEAHDKLLESLKK